VPEYCFVAPDGVTIIPEQYDLARASSIAEAIPGQPFYGTDEYGKRTARMQVEPDGTLTNLMHFTEQGDFGAVTDKNGNVYVIHGHVYVFNKNGECIRIIEVPERPASIVIGGKEGNMLFMAARSSLYRVVVNI
jgi:sugar lactone lactonase YvrE